MSQGSQSVRSLVLPWAPHSPLGPKGVPVQAREGGQSRAVNTVPLLGPSASGHLCAQGPWAGLGAQPGSARSASAAEAAPPSRRRALSTAARASTTRTDGACGRPSTYSMLRL